MNMLKYIIVNIIETLLRAIPFRCKIGLIKIGNPDKDSPVFSTCNYHLTVQRVKRALSGIDCYLLVANSNGHNVWCGATGGHFTNHDVISIIKTSRIEELVNHRKVVLPQLAATGIESKIIQKKTGWSVVWGPVYAKDIPDFVKNDFKKNPSMQQVKFPWTQRVEMAVMWAFPFSIIATLIIIPIWRGLIITLNILIWGLPFLLFLLFPFYSKLLNPKKRGMSFSKYTIIFDFGRVPLIIWGLFMLFLVVYSILTYNFSYRFILQWGILSLVIILIISLDLAGSTPLYKSGLHEDRFLKVTFDNEKCTGCGFCVRVCPRNCFKVDNNRHIVRIIGDERCVQCGACIVQCSFNALYFKTPKGEIIPPGIIRKYKLNLLSKRLVKVEGKER